MGGQSRQLRDTWPRDPTHGNARKASAPRRRRLWWQSLGSKLAWCWCAALLVAALAIGLGKLTPALDQQLWAIGWIGGSLCVGLAAAVVWTTMRQASTLAAALEIDRRFGLKERVSSTLSLDVHTRETAPAGRW